MARIRVELNHAWFREFLLGPEVRGELQRRSEKVAEAANSDPAWDQLVSGDPGTERVNYDAKVERHGDRAVGIVAGEHPAALNVEAKHRVLGRAIDAAGD